MKKILTILTILSLLVGVVSSILGWREKQKSDRLETNLHEVRLEYEDEMGRKVTEITRLQITNKELRTIKKADSTKMNDYEKRLFRFTQEIDASNRKLKQMESAMLVTMETNFSDTKVALDSSINSMPVKSANFKDIYGDYLVNYYPSTDSIELTVTQRNELFIDWFKQRKPNKKGKQVWYPIRWVKKWEHKASIKTINDSTVVKDFTVIDFN